FADFKKQFNIDFLEEYHKQIKDLSEKNLIQLSEGKMALTQKGREISNTVFIEFMN
ncbi:MAG: coproporphyrinogen III oxidase, partial [Peptostreptococcaceae bacterium]|nr:coproporphyrinogen III oxidase [Peptostreptococcaceae bacterium]